MRSDGTATRPDGQGHIASLAYQHQRPNRGPTLAQARGSREAPRPCPPNPERPSPGPEKKHPKTRRPKNGRGFRLLGPDLAPLAPGRDRAPQIEEWGEPECRPTALSLTAASLACSARGWRLPR